MKLARLALLILALSCRDSVGPTHELVTLEQAYARWSSQHLHTYAFTLQRSCFCLNTHPLYVLVVNDKVTGVLDLQTGAQVDAQLGETVEDLFGFIRSAIVNHAALIEAEYDSTQGFPTSINYDGSAQFVDDEVFYRVSDVHTIIVATQ